MEFCFIKTLVKKYLPLFWLESLQLKIISWGPTFCQAAEYLYVISLGSHNNFPR